MCQFPAGSIGLEDLRGLFQPSSLCDSVIPAHLCVCWFLLWMCSSGWLCENQGVLADAPFAPGLDSVSKPAELLCLLCFQSSSVHTESAGAGVSCCFGGYYQEMLTRSLPLFSTSHHHTWRINLWNTIWSSQPCTSPAQLFNIPQPWGSWSAFSAPSLAQFRSHWGSSWP